MIAHISGPGRAVNLGVGPVRSGLDCRLDTMAGWRSAKARRRRTESVNHRDGTGSGDAPRRERASRQARAGRGPICGVRRDGHDPSVRPRDPGVRVVVGQIDDDGVLRDALEGSAGVIVALGPRRDRLEEADALEAGMRTLTAAIAHARIRRLVALSGAGFDVPGDDKPTIDRIVFGSSDWRPAAWSAPSDASSPCQCDPPGVDGSSSGHRPRRPGTRLSALRASLARGADDAADVGQALVDQLHDSRSFAPRRSPAAPISHGGAGTHRLGKTQPIHRVRPAEVEAIDDVLQRVPERVVASPGPNYLEEPRCDVCSPPCSPRPWPSAWPPPRSAPTNRRFRDRGRERRL